MPREIGERGLGQYSTVNRRFELGAFERNTQQELLQFQLVLEVLLLLTNLRFVQRWLRDVDVAALNEIGHLAIEEREQKRADVCTVDVGIGHDDDAVVAQLLDVVIVLAKACAHRRDERNDLLGRDDLIEARFFNVQHLAAQRQNRLEFTVAALFGGAACGVTLHQIKLAQLRIFFLTISKLSRQTHRVKHAFTTRHLAGFTCRFTSARCIDNFAANDLRVRRIFEQEVS